MKRRNLIILKILGIGMTILFSYSLLWGYMMYLYGLLYYPINETEIKQLVGFEWFVIAISLGLFYLMLFKWKQNGFWYLVVQNTGLIMISFPFYAIVLGLIGIGLDDNVQLFDPFLTIMILTVLTININDWRKLRKASN